MTFLIYPLVGKSSHKAIIRCYHVILLFPIWPVGASHVKSKRLNQLAWTLNGLYSASSPDKVWIIAVHLELIHLELAGDVEHSCLHPLLFLPVYCFPFFTCKCVANTFSIDINAKTFMFTDESLFPCTLYPDIAHLNSEFGYESSCGFFFFSS